MWTTAFKASGVRSCPPIFSMQHSFMESDIFSTGTQFLTCSYNHILLSYQYYDCIAQGITQCLWTLRVKREISFDLYVLFAIVICSVSVSALKLISLVVCQPCGHFSPLRRLKAFTESVFCLALVTLGWGKNRSNYEWTKNLWFMFSCVDLSGVS